MTITDDEGNIISEKDAIKTTLKILDEYKADTNSDFDRGFRAMKALIQKSKEKHPSTKGGEHR